MKQMKLFFLSGLFLLAEMHTGRAQQVIWNFTAANPSTNTLTNCTVSGITGGGGSSFGINSTSVSSGYAGVTGGNNACIIYSQSSTGSAYFEFTITPDAGYTVSVTGITLGTRSTATGPGNGAIRSNVDGYASNYGMIVPMASGTSWMLRTPASLNPITGAAGTAVTVRIYGYGTNTSSNSSSSPNWRIDDLQVTAAVTNIVCVSSSDTLKETICDNQLPYIWNGITVPAGGTAVARDTFTNAAGCDSILTLDLIVNQTSSTDDNLVICSNELPYTWNGIMVTGGGAAVARDTFVNAAGCDSIVTLNLTVNQTSAYTESVVICSNELPYTWNGNTVIQGGPAAAVYTTLNSLGCDSVITLDLTVSPASETTVGLTICTDQLPFVWHGTSLTQGGVAVATHKEQNSLGCDSTVTLNLTVEQVVVPEVYITATPGHEISPGRSVTFASWVTNSGVNPTIIWRKNGEQVGTSNIAYTDNDLQDGDSITCTVYSSIFCARPDSVVSKPIIIAVTNVTGITGIDAAGSKLRLYPNPNNGMFIIEGTVSGENASVEIIDQTGRVVCRYADVSAPAGKLHLQAAPKDLPAGIYFVRINSDRQVQTLRFVTVKQ